MNQLLTLLLVGLSVGMGNFAASIAIGLGGVSKSLRLRIALVFGTFETVMPVVGLLIGQQLANFLGGNANIIGGGLLSLTGIYLVISSFKKTDKSEVKQASKDWGKLLMAGFCLSIDNLIVGFSLGTRKVPLLLAVVVIGLTSITLSLIGLELGNKLGSRVEEYSEVLSGLILVLVGLLIVFKVL